MEIFQRRDISRILGIPFSRLANWEAGRTLKLTPSIREARGGGSSNLYSRSDVYVIALADMLLHLGYPGESVQAVIDPATRMSPDGTIPIEHRAWLRIVWLSKGKPQIVWSMGPEIDRTALAVYCLNVAKLRATVDAEIQTWRGKHGLPKR